MKSREYIQDNLFNKDGHYFGRPADFGDQLILRRISLLEQVPGFFGKENTLLDIGCGNGASMFLLSQKMKKCVGIDITDEHKVVFNDFMKKNEITNCELRILDVVKEKAKEKFDRIISFEVIEHLSDETGVKFYYDSLKDDGLMAVSVPNKWWPFETHGAKLPLLPWNRVPFFSWLPKSIHEKYANARIYTKERITKLLEKYGFEVLSLQYITTPLDHFPDGKIKEFLLTNIFKTTITKIPPKAPAIFVIAKKKSENR